MTPLTSEEQIKLYGKLLVNFANARNSDEACKELITGIQRAFNFSINFVKKSEKILPSLRDFKSTFSKQEKELMKLVLAERDIKEFLNRQFELLNRNLTDYNSEKNTLTFQDIILYGGAYEGEIEVDVEFTRPYSMHIKDIESHEWEMMEPRTLDKIKQLIKVGNRKRRYRKNISKERYSELKNLSKTYQQISALHGQIDGLQNRLKKTLNQIVGTRKLYGNENYESFLSSYRTYCRLDTYLLPDDTFDYKAEFMKEDYYLKGQEKHGYRKTFAYLITPVPFFLVEFLKQPKNKKLIHICDECENYFISKTIRPTRFCSDKCRLSWHNRKRIESGEHRDYKRKKRKEGAKESYYG